MSYITEFKDCVKGDVALFRANIMMQQQNIVGVHKVREKDALTCWGTCCDMCYECRTQRCYACKKELFVGSGCVCKQGEGNIRLNPEYMRLHPEDYIALIRECHE